MNKSISGNKSDDLPKLEEHKTTNGTNGRSGSFSNNNKNNTKSVSNSNNTTSNNTNSKKSSLVNNLVCQDSIELIEDFFGKYYDENGNLHNIKRFTWRNKNKIQVQVINYGARIISIKMPDRKGAIHDIVLGFDDIAGYIHNKDFFFGATIGRMTNVVKNSTFVIDNKQYWLNPNSGPHHYNGGRVGLDQVIWTTFVSDKKVIMSHVSPHMSEGYPGDLLIRVMFELSTRNEFTIKMEAQCTQPTIVNLSNLTFFNLGENYSGPYEIYRHIVTLNCNCFTPLVDGIPSGAIMNVVHSGFDFQVPITLGKVMGIVPKDGFDQNLCVNRGITQGDCFVARVLHPPSGRMLEVYSNQPGLRLYTANDFGYNEVLSFEELVKTPPPSVVSITKCEGPEPLLRLYEKVHSEIQDSLAKDEDGTFKNLYDLIKKIKDFDALEVNVAHADPHYRNIEEEKFFSKHRSFVPCDFMFTLLQLEYLNDVLKVLCDNCDEDTCEELKEILKLIISLAKVTDEQEEEDEENSEGMGEENAEGNEKEVTSRGSVEGNRSKRNSMLSNASKGRRKTVKQNVIPEFYLSTKKIIGKERAHYKTHSGIAFQTQNYPGSANFKNFPSCVLKPGETYTHTITYKFWIRAGNPTKWIKRNAQEV